MRAEAWTALVTSSDTNTKAGSRSPSNCRSRSVWRSMRRAHGTADGSAASRADKVGAGGKSLPGGESGGATDPVRTGAS
jgi:hypothetical protein